MSGIRKKIVFLIYDADTAIGIDNYGRISFSYNLEDIDLTAGGEKVYAGQDSVLWKNVRAAFFPELANMYKNLRASGKFSYDIVNQMFDDHQGKWPEALKLEDSNFKYILPYIENGEDRLAMCLGFKKEQRKWWLYNRFKYMDSKYNAGDASADSVSMRSWYTPAQGETVYGIDVTPYADIYATVLFGVAKSSVRAARNVSSKVPCTLDHMEFTDTYIYSASQIKDFGDLSIFKPDAVEFSRAINVQSLKFGDATSGYTNPNLKSITLGNNVKLRTLDLRNCVNLGTDTQKTVDLTGCKNIENIYMDGTAVRGVTLPNGGILKKLHLPGTVQNLTIMNQPFMTEFVCPDYSNITTLRLENVPDSVVDSKAILADISAASRVRLIGFYWTADDAEEIEDILDTLDTMRGLDEQGNTINVADGGCHSSVSGEIHTISLTGAQIAAFNERYPYLRVTADYTESTRTFKTWDGSSTVGTVTCLNGVPQSAAPTAPARSATAQYNFTPLGWATTQDASTANYQHDAVTPGDVTYYAAYSRETRSYTITFQRASDDGGGTLQTRTLQYGTMASYTGSTPTTTKGSASDYPFEGWSPALATVTGAKTYTAVFGSPIQVAEIADDWDTIIANIANGTATYRVGNYKPLSFGTEGTINMQIVGKGSNASELTDGTGRATYDWLGMELLKTDNRMNPSKQSGTEGTGSIGGYGKSEMRTYMNGDIYGKIANANVKAAIKEVKKYSDGFNTSETSVKNMESSEKVWIPSARELFGGTSYETSGVTYNGIFTNDSSRIKKKAGSSSASWWWTRSASGANFFRGVSTGGSVSSGSAYGSSGVCPGFSL